MARRIKRNYRQLASTAAKFHGFCQKVKIGLTDNPHYPDSVWGTSAALRQRYFEEVDRLGLSCHLASNGDRVLIRNRDMLIQEIILLLDEIASLLDAASVRNPNALFTTGFSVTQERKSPSKTRLPLAAPSDFTVSNTSEKGKAVGGASTMPGVFNCEIHVNQTDPSVEANWFHKAIFPDAAEMVMENLDSGNTFFRVRYHGPEGHGPWSAIVSTTIT